MKYLLIALLALVSLKANSQNFVWANAVEGGVGGGGVSAQMLFTDRSGNSFTIGDFGGVPIDIDPGPGVHNLSLANGDQYILKLDANGNFIWAVQFSLYHLGITIDDTGSIYITGAFSTTTDFDPDTVLVHNLSPVGTGDGFLLKLDSAGQFSWVKQIGGMGSSCYAIAVTVDDFDNIVVNGLFDSIVDFDPGLAVHNITAPAPASMFLLKLDGHGDFKWASAYTIPMLNIFDYLMETDHYGNIICLNAVDTMSIAKFDSSGNFNWSRRFSSGSYTPEMKDIAIDEEGNIYATGSFMNSMDFDPGPGVSMLWTVNKNAFVLKLDNAGQLIWAKQFEGNYVQTATALATDTNNAVYIVGSFADTADFDPGPGVYSLQASFNFSNFSDAYIVKLSAAGNFLLAKRMGGKDVDKATGISLDSAGNVYMCGAFNDTADFDPGSAVYNLIGFDYFPDVFIMKLGSTSWVSTPGIGVAQAAIFLYPNPATEDLTIKTDKQYISYTISNSIGQVMMENKLTAKESKVNIRSLTPGIYYITLKGGRSSEVRKFVKM